jgi:hypothetical protein
MADSTETSTSSETGASLDSLDSAAQAMAGLMFPGTKKPTGKASADPAEGSDDEEDEAPEDDDGEDAGDEEAEGEGEEEGDEPEDEPEEQDEEGQDEDPEDDENRLVTVKIDGKTEKVTLTELKNGYSRTKVFTQRTQEAAEKVRAAEALRSTIEQERQAVAEVARSLHQQLQSAEQEPDWDTLRNEDPVEWAIQKQVWADKAAQRQSLKAVELELQRRNQEAQATRLQETLASERAALLGKVPEWKDEAKATKDLTKLRAFMVNELGFTDDEAGQVYDHRAVLALRDAMRFRDLMARQEKLKTGGTPTKVVDTTLEPNKGPKPKTGKARAAKEAFSRLQKTGRQDDAARAIAALGLI